MGELPENVLHVSFGCVDDGNPASFGLWLHVDQALLLGPSDFGLIVYDWYTFCQPTFLDCMAVSTSFTTCRIARGGIAPYKHVELLPPNAGAQPEGQPMATTAGLYLAPQRAGRGLGTRMHLPGLPQRFVDRNAKLSGYGIQQLGFAAVALNDWVLRLQTDLGRAVELITLSTRRGGLPLVPPEYQPVASIRPTFRIETLGRRMRASGGFSSP